jgi:hypothetical protein
MPTRRVTFVLPFDDSDESDSGEDDYDSDFENTPDPDEQAELPLDEEIILLEDNDDPSDEDEAEEGTSFVDIEEFLAELALIEPLELPPAIIPIIPSNATKPKARNYYDDGTRIQALTLQEQGVPAWRIKNITGMDHTTLSRLRKKAISRGWEEGKDQPLLLEHVSDAPKSGRPPLSQEICDEVLRVVTKNSTSRMYSCQKIADVVSENLGKEDIISGSTVYRVLKRNGYGNFKPTVKPGLTQKMKDDRLAWCLAHRNVDWKLVVFTDETSVQLGGVRGRRRVWRKKDETFHAHVVRQRWKGFSEFMFWGSFSYYVKGECHIWKPETAEEKKASKIDLEKRNKAIEAENKKKWTEKIKKAAQDYLEEHGRNKGGPKPTWRHTKKNGAVIREKGRGGIDWYRYQEVVLKKILLPWVKKIKKTMGLDLMVQEDGAPAHASEYQQQVFDAFEVIRIL